MSVKRNTCTTICTEQREKELENAFTIQDRSPIYAHAYQIRKDHKQIDMKSFLRCEAKEKLFIARQTYPIRIMLLSVLEVSLQHEHPRLVHLYIWHWG